MMTDIIQQKIKQLMNEAQSLLDERESIRNRNEEIDIRMHQIAGALYELEGLLSMNPTPDPDHLPSDSEPVYENSGAVPVPHHQD